MRRLSILLFAFAACSHAADLDPLIERELPSLVATYVQLHQAPELSHHEEKTSAWLAGELRKLGYQVTEHVGRYASPKLTGYGVVGLLKNGEGPVLLIRTDMDALPVQEQTGLPYASKVRTKNEAGQEVSVMHACGHDVHMSAVLGAAKLLAGLKSQWHGTVMIVGQPAEETIDGARAMIADNFYQRFPKPTYAIALHDLDTLEAGKVAIAPEFILADSTSVDITVRGLGGHGSAPERTKDPIVMAAELVVALQTIVSRENSPFDPAVVTVGSIHGGSKHNIIPDEVHLQLTVRVYKESVREHVMASIRRITQGLAMANGIPPERAPIVTVSDEEHTPATWNEPKLEARVKASIEKAIGAGNVVVNDPVMGGEDFGRFSLDGQIPSCMFRLGAVDPKVMAEHKASGKPLPSLHSSLFAPLPEPALRTGVKSLTAAALDLLR